MNKTKKGNHWSIIQTPKDKIRHRESKKYAKIEAEKIKEEAKALAKAWKE